MDINLKKGIINAKKDVSLNGNKLLKKARAFSAVTNNYQVVIYPDKG